MKPLSLLRNARRAKEVLAVLVRYGFGEVLRRLDIPPTLLIRQLVSPRDIQLTLPQRIRTICEELGPTSVKFGQVLSTRPDILPEPFIEELKHLRDSVKAVPFAKIQPIIETELGGPLSDLFASFEEIPLAAGSIGQVYRAKLAPTGEAVAVKVQRPDIRDAIEADLEILSWLARQAHQRIEDLRPYDLPTVLETLRKAILIELDFTHEANHLETFAALNPYEPEVFAPRPYRQHCTRHVLVSQLVRGLTPAEATAFAPEVRRQLARNGARSVLHQIITSGFFHADPHGGNLLITPNGHICLLDWGTAGRLTQSMRFFLADLLAAILARDPENVARLAIELDAGRQRLDRHRLEVEISAALLRYPSAEQAAHNVGQMVMELIHIFGTSGIPVARDYTLLAKAIISVEESGKTLDPSFSLANHASPFLRKLALERRNPRLFLRRSRWAIESVIQRLTDLPGDAQRVLRRLEDGQITVQLHTELDDAADRASAAVNRLAMAVILAGCVIGSSLVISSGQGPMFRGFNIIGVTGYLISLFTGIWIVFDMIRHGRHR